MQQKSELLEREKALKQSEIDVHRATIERLKALQAPAIAHDLEQMTRTANTYADLKRELEGRVAMLERKNETTAAVAEKSMLMGITAGCLESLALIAKIRNLAMGRALFYSEPIEDDFLVNRLNKTVQDLSTTAEQALNGQKPDLKNMM